MKEDLLLFINEYAGDDLLNDVAIFCKLKSGLIQASENTEEQIKRVYQEGEKKQARAEAELQKLLARTLKPEEPVEEF